MIKIKICAHTLLKKTNPWKQKIFIHAVDFFVKTTLVTFAICKNSCKLSKEVQIFRLHDMSTWIIAVFFNSKRDKLSIIKVTDILNQINKLLEHAAGPSLCFFWKVNCTKTGSADDWLRPCKLCVRPERQERHIGWYTYAVNFRLKSRRHMKIARPYACSDQCSDGAVTFGQCWN